MLPRLRLTIKDVDADDQAGYRCEATKDGKVASADFDLTVIMPAVCEHQDGTTWEEGTIYNPQVLITYYHCRLENFPLY